MRENEFLDFAIEQKIEKAYGEGRVYIVDERAFQFVYKPEVAYWIGFIMADGSIGENDKGESYCLSICLSEKDINHLQKFRIFLHSNIPIHKHKDKKTGKSNCRINVNSKKLTKDLEQYGIIPRKRGKEQIKNIPSEYIRDFILGYFDGDGCICKNKNSRMFTIASSSLNIIKKIHEILIFQCGLNKTKIQKRLDGVNILAFGGNQQAKRIYEFLYERGGGSIDYLERKKDKFLD